MTDGVLLGRTPRVQCESRVLIAGTNMSRHCTERGTYIYGPECEATTGKLMYLCDSHAQFIADWRAEHMNDPVECPRHGRIGKVRDYLILKKMP